MIYGLVVVRYKQSRIIELKWNSTCNRSRLVANHVLESSISNFWTWKVRLRLLLDQYPKSVVDNHLVWGDSQNVVFGLRWALQLNIQYGVEVTQISKLVRKVYFHRIISLFHLENCAIDGEIWARGTQFTSFSQVCRELWIDKLLRSQQKWEISFKID